ncbi:MAG: TRAP transporter small permease [Chloroflexota bacterium]
MSVFIKTVEWISHKFSIIGVVTLAGLMLLTVSDVVLRFFFTKPIQGSLEVTELLMIVMVYPGLAWVAVRRMNIKVDLLVNRFSPRAQGIFDTVTCLISLAVAVLIAWFTVPQVFYMQSRGIETDTLHIKHWPFYWLIAFAYAVLCLVLITNLIDFIKKAVKG